MCEIMSVNARGLMGSFMCYGFYLRTRGGWNFWMSQFDHLNVADEWLFACCGWQYKVYSNGTIPQGIYWKTIVFHTLAKPKHKP